MHLHHQAAHAAALATLATLLPAQVDARELLARHAAFVGGNALAAREFVQEGTIETAGQRLRYRAFVQKSPFAFRQEVFAGNQDSPALVRITDGRYAWQPGEDGKHELLTGGAAQITLEAAFFDGLLYLDPAQISSRAGRGPEMMLPLPPHLPAGVRGNFPVLPVAFAAPGGSTITLHFDVDDARLHGLVNAEFSPQRYVRFTDWQQFGPLQLPAVRYEALVGEAPTRVVLDRVRYEPLDPGLFGKAPVPALPPQQIVSALRVVPQPIPGACQFVVPRVDLPSGHGLSALVDSGATQIYLATEMADRLRLPVLSPKQSRGHFGSAAASHRWLDSLQIGPLRLHQLVIATVLLPSIVPIDGKRQPAVILGGELFTECAPVLDLRNNKLIVRGAPVRALRAPDDGVAVATLTLHRAHALALPELEVGIGDRKLMAVIDTGLHVALRLSPAGLRRAGLPVDAGVWRERGALVMRTVGAGGIGGTDFLAQIPLLQIGPVRIEQPWVLITCDESAATASGHEAILGCGALRAFAQVGFDSQRGKLELAIGPEVERTEAGFRIAPPGQFLGLIASSYDVTAAESSLPIVEEVVKNSPAATKGIRAGDRLATVGGVNVAGQEPRLWNERLWIQPGQRIELELVRDGKRFTVTLP